MAHAPREHPPSAVPSPSRTAYFRCVKEPALSGLPSPIRDASPCGHLKLVQHEGVDTASHAESGTAAPSNDRSLGVGRARAGLARARALFLVFVYPGAALSGALAEGSPRFALGGSGAAFGLLFLQTGLDLLRAGGPTLPLLALSGPLGVVGLTLIGLPYGTVGVWLLGVMAFVGTRPFGGTLGLGPTVRAMGSATARRSSMSSSAWPPTCSGRGTPPWLSGSRVCCGPWGR